MCGRAYSTQTADELYLQFLNRKPLDGSDLSLKLNYNMSPTQDAPIVRQADGTPGIALMRWGTGL